MTNKDCFAYKHGKCKALIDIDCNKCPFCKCREQVREDRFKAFERLKTLSLLEQLHIATKYYEGTMPWMA